MRFKNFVQDIVGTEIKHQFNNAVDLSRNINGGWEVWLQVQLYMRLRDHAGGVLSFEREAFYRGLTLRSDFAVVPKTASNITLWVELKAQRKDDYAQAVKEFGQSIQKITSSNVQKSFTQNDTAGAIVVIPSRPWDAVQEVKNTFGSDFTKVGYCLVDASGVSPPTNLNNSLKQSDVDGKALILYYISK